MIYMFFEVCCINKDNIEIDNKFSHEGTKNLVHLMHQSPRSKGIFEIKCTGLLL